MAGGLLGVPLGHRRQGVDEGHNRRQLFKFDLERILADENVVPALPLVANPCHCWLVSRPGVRELIRRIRATWRRRVENGMDFLGVEPGDVEVE